MWFLKSFKQTRELSNYSFKGSQFLAFSSKDDDIQGNSRKIFLLYSKSLNILGLIRKILFFQEFFL